MQRSVPHARGKGLVNGIPAVLSVASDFAIWEMYVRLSGISPLILPAPSPVVDQIVQNRALLWGHTVPTMKAALAGFACSVSVSMCQRQSKSGPKGSAKCCYFRVGVIADGRARASGLPRLS